MRWIICGTGMTNWSQETGILKGYDDKTLEWVIKTKQGLVRADMVCDEKERIAYFENIGKAYSNGFRDGMTFQKQHAEL